MTRRLWSQARAVAIGLLVLAFLVTMALKVARGRATLHLYAPPGAAIAVTVDGAPLAFEPSSAWHRMAELARGKHQVVVAENGATQAWSIDAGGLDHLLLPRKGQCFVWWTWTGRRELARLTVGTRFDDAKVIELPGDSVIGSGDLEGLTSRPPALFDQVPCDASNEALQRELDGAGGGTGT